MGAKDRVVASINCWYFSSRDDRDGGEDCFRSDVDDKQTGDNFCHDRDLPLENKENAEARIIGSRERKRRKARTKLMPTIETSLERFILHRNLFVRLLILLPHKQTESILIFREQGMFRAPLSTIPISR